MNSQRPYFIWDYDLTEGDVYRLLQGENEVDRRWMLGRILTSATYDDVWKYTTIKDIVRDFPKLRMRKEVKEAWSRALTVWGYHV